MRGDRRIHISKDAAMCVACLNCFCRVSPLVMTCSNILISADCAGMAVENRTISGKDVE